MQAMTIASQKHPAVISQFVLMSNHYHLLIRTPNCDIDLFMYWFNKTFSEKLRRASGMENRMFGSNYKWSIIMNPNYFKNVFRYIYQNPLRANITDKCEFYPYSTFHYYTFQKQLPFKFTPINHLEKDNEFINDICPLEQQEEIRKGLKKSVFKEVTPRKY
jgi:putative transposase